MRLKNPKRPLHIYFDRNSFVLGISVWHMSILNNRGKNNHYYSISIGPMTIGIRPQRKTDADSSTLNY